MSKILLVDDEQDILQSMFDVLQRPFGKDNVLMVDPRKPYPNGIRLWTETPDLRIALVDLQIPGPNGEHPNTLHGYTLVAHLKKARPDARVGILTGWKDHHYLAQAIACGADHFLSKGQPIEQLCAAVAFLKAWLPTATSSAPVALTALSEMVALRDPYTAGHSFRVRDYCLAIAQFLEHADGENFDLAACKLGAELHDLGKLEIPDDILLGASGMSEEQRQVMQRHVNAVLDLGKFLGPEFQRIGWMAHQHHRAYRDPDSPRITDYPKDSALPRQDHMPLEVRIMHVADVLDALLSDRSYRPGLPFDAALNIIRDEEAGGGFDPQVVRALEKLRSDPEGFKLLQEIERRGRISYAPPFLDLYFSDRRLTPGRLSRLLDILSDVYLRNGKAADALAIRGVRIGNYGKETVRVQLAGARESLEETRQILERRQAESEWCRSQQREFRLGRSTEIPDQIRDLVDRNIRDVPTRMAWSEEAIEEEGPRQGESKG